MLADYHVHTSFSNDSDYDMEEVIKRAIEIGVKEICFTEHVDHYPNHKNYLVDYPNYKKEFQRVKEKYKDNITMKFGVEFGVQLHMIENFKIDFKENDFDFVILSNHQINNQEFWTGDYQRGKTQLQYNREYYEAIYEVMKNYKNYSILGHLDMIKRYDHVGILDDLENEDIIKKILILAIEEGKGIEVNTSCFRYKLPDLTPSRTILKWYYELGGKILTIGSDSHKEGDLAFGINEVKEELKKIGFSEFCTFSKMKPTFHKL